MFALHIPVMVLLAWTDSTGPGLAALPTTAVVAGFGIAHRRIDNPRRVSVVLGMAAMFMGGLLVHFGQGRLPIEMHFYFVALLGDGKCIDLTAIAVKARSRGLPASTAAELPRALFVGGVSTAEIVSDRSGRGIGMGALLEGITLLGDDLAMDGVPGRGTTLRMTFPQSAARPLSAMSAAA